MIVEKPGGKWRSLEDEQLEGAACPKGAFLEDSLLGAWPEDSPWGVLPKGSHKELSQRT